MILQALVEHYEDLLNRGNIQKPVSQKKKFTFDIKMNLQNL